VLAGNLLPCLSPNLLCPTVPGLLLPCNTLCWARQSQQVVALRRRLAKYEPEEVANADEAKQR
jgi:hypothetical protein